MLDQNLLKNHLYSTSVIIQMIEQNAMIHDTEVEVHHEIFVATKTIIHKTDIALHLEIDSVLSRVLLLLNTLDHDKTIIKGLHGPTALLTDLPYRSP